jgi:hypothetical protein
VNISGSAGQRETLRRADREADRAARRRVQPTGLHKAGDRFDAGDLETEASGELDGVLALAAPGVHHRCTDRKHHLCDVPE